MTNAKTDADAFSFEYVGENVQTTVRDSMGKLVTYTVATDTFVRSIAQASRFMNQHARQVSTDLKM